MKKVTLMFALLFTSAIFTSCEKNKDVCWVCTDNSGLDQNFCDQSEDDIKNLETAGWDCRKQ